MNAALLPIMHRYLDKFRKGVAEQGVSSTPYVIQSNGGLISPQTLQQIPINTFFSGPAGGVVGATRLAKVAGIKNIITFDIGGTSTDVCLVKNGEPQRTNLQELVGLPVRTPSIDLHTIGAGGGSVAWVDAGGLPKVGPQSAGARPGPAAYGRGGTLPTLTDANVVLGRLNPVSLLDGAMPVDAVAARKAIETGVASVLNLKIEDAAAGILEIATLNMTGAVRVISVERGENPREYAIVAFGGGGPLHAAEVAESIDISRVVVPAHPGLMSAIGLLSADIRGDFGQTCLTVATAEGLPSIRSALETLGEKAASWIETEGLKRDQVVFQRFVELRYVGQSSELSVAIDSDAMSPDVLGWAVDQFHRLHDARFGYSLEGRDVEAVAVRLVTIARRPELPGEKPSPPNLTGRRGSRSVWFRGTGFVETPVIQRVSLAAGDKLPGPVILEQMDTTTVVPPNWTAHADNHGNVILIRDVSGEGV
jgi:N-methylhydantoinase A